MLSVIVNLHAGASQREKAQAQSRCGGRARAAPFLALLQDLRHHHHLSAAHGHACCWQGGSCCAICPACIPHRHVCLIIGRSPHTCVVLGELRSAGHACGFTKACNVWFLSQAHCRRLATGHLPAAAQGVALDADPVVESARKEMPKGPAPGRPALPGSSGPMHPSVPPPPPRAPSALINRLAVRILLLNVQYHREDRDL